MKKSTLLAFGSAFLLSGTFYFEAQGDVSRGQHLPGHDLVDTASHGTHSDCQKDKKGRSHWHKGLKNIKVSCPGGKK